MERMHPRPWTSEKHEDEFQNVVIYIKDAKGAAVCREFRGGPREQFNAAQTSLIVDAILKTSGGVK